MKFFDPKTEVIDLEITPYGRYLISRGKFRPQHYAFFDDDVLYDTEYANFSESQNQAQTRIKEETPRLKTQASYAGVETNVKKVNKLVRSGEAKLGEDRIQPTAEKHYAMSAPLGTSGKDTHYAPSWRIKYLSGEISGSIDYTTGSYSTLRIPQLTSSMEYIIYAEEKTHDISSSINQVYNFPDGTSLRVEENILVLEINEDNTDFLTENFDIEVYKIETEKDLPIPSGQKEELIPLSFVKNKKVLNTSFLLEEEIEETIPDVDPRFVEYFLDIEVDNEIDRKLLCKLKQRNRTENIFTNDDLGCDELEEETKPENIFINKVKRFEECK